jgi:hypothetical protein
MGQLMTPEKTERIEHVSELAARRLSAAEIAMRMGCTRNAIIGLCDRHGIMLLGVKGARVPRPSRPHRIRSAEDKAHRKAACKPHPRPIYKPSRILMWAGLL